MSLEQKWAEKELNGSRRLSCRVCDLTLSFCDFIHPIIPTFLTLAGDMFCANLGHFAAQLVFYGQQCASGSLALD